MPVSQESPLEVASPFSATAERAGSESGTTPSHVSKSFADTQCRVSWQSPRAALVLKH